MPKVRDCTSMKRSIEWTSTFIAISHHFASFIGPSHPTYVSPSRLRSLDVRMASIVHVCGTPSRRETVSSIRESHSHPFYARLQHFELNSALEGFFQYAVPFPYRTSNIEHRSSLDIFSLPHFISNFGCIFWRWRRTIPGSLYGQAERSGYVS